MVLVSLDQQNNHGIMDEENQDSLCSSDFSEGGDFSNFTSSEGEDGNFSESSDPTSPSSSSSRNEHKIGALQNMSSLLQELPFKRGLSKHYNGKSQSFTSLSNVISLEDMAKPENPYNKRLKSCKSYGVFLEGFKSDHAVIKSSSFSRHNSKKTCSSLRARRNGSFKKNGSPMY
ncbi:hypothetical protein K7X08_026883 [Anisodus acutangulus]|uniref:Oxidative stress 3 n=1 Tax=Anisodus acutangulus TaxID=402998 RepID=A0A9Q1LCM0_9SOLA|nr:hypothetical protein K7X08_026883 [Anisodus acutangulus]